MRYFSSLQSNQEICININEQTASLRNKPNKAADWKRLLHGTAEREEKSIKCYSFNQHNSQPQKINGHVKTFTGYTDKKENPHQTMKFITQKQVQTDK